MNDNVLTLVVLQDGVPVEVAVLSHKDACIKSLVPSRAPDARGEKYKLWVVAMEKRESMVKRVDAVLDKLGTSKDMLFGYFGLMGIALRWIKDASVEIGLCLSTEELKAGTPLGG